MNDPGGAPEFDEGAGTDVRPRYQSPPPSDPAFALEVVDGPDTGLRYLLDPTEPSPILIGQGPVCRFRLTDREVSRRHAAIDVVDGRIRLRDLGSTNGTYAGGIAVVEVYLAGGELVRMGSTTVRVDVAARPDAALEDSDRFGRVIGQSPAMRRLYPLLHRIAHSNIPVVIEGETGTGKEILAESIHEQGPRAAGAFVVFDCTAVPANLVESELFGHERGAFTSAVAMRKGVFEQAHGGTLLIDEIGDLSIDLQPKLLRAIERSEVRRVGGDRSIRVDVRVLCATRRDLDHEVQEGRFRDDLFHRLAVGRVELPPLRQRRGDVALLARRFWTELGGGERPLPHELLVRWEDSPWPGNVRELRNVVARQLALGELGDRETGADAGHNANVIEEVIAQRLPFPLARLRVMQEFERRYVSRLLSDCGGNVVQAAAASGVGRRYFHILKARLEK